MISAFTIGVIMSLVSLILCQIYIVMSGGQFLGIFALIKVLGLILLSTLTGTSMVLLMVSFFKSTNAFATASTVIGTLIGFLTGMYIPIGSLPQTVQYIVKLFPPSHAAALFRQVIMEKPMSEAFAHAPGTVSDSFRQSMGIDLTFQSKAIPAYANVLVLAAAAALFISLSIFVMARKRK